MSTPISQLLTATPQYIHHIPPKDFDLHLEFDYPSYWIFKEEGTYSELITITMMDPRFLALPAQLPNAVDSHPGGPGDFGSITIWVSPHEPGLTSGSELESLKVNYSNITWMTVLDDYKTTMDGYEASVLEYQINRNIENDALTFNRRIFFVVQAQLYQIYFSVAEKDRGGTFEKGYRYFLDSLKIVP